MNASRGRLIRPALGSGPKDMLMFFNLAPGSRERSESEDKSPV